MMYKRVLLPTDGSKCAMKGVEQGLELASALEIKALSIFVIDSSEYTGLHHESIKSSARCGLKEQGKKALREVEELAEKREVELKTKLVEGSPYKEITGEADKDDIVYISTHGMSGFTHMFLGSTTERVLKNTEATVAVVHGK